MSGNRRRSRGARANLAVLVLVAGLLLLAPALVLASRPLLSGAALAAYLCGLVAVSLLSVELLHTRRWAGFDRAQQARAYAAATAARVREHEAFVTVLDARLASRTAAVTALRSELVVLRARAEEAESVAGQEARRADSLRERAEELEVRVAELTAAVEAQQSLTGESLAFWYGRQNPDVGDVLDWEAQAVQTREAQAREAAAREQA